MGALLRDKGRAKVVRVGAVLAHELMEINPRFPGVTQELRESLHEAKRDARGAGIQRRARRPVRAGTEKREGGRKRRPERAQPNLELAAPADPPASE